jgi:hypothetical protein
MGTTIAIGSVALLLLIGITWWTNREESDDAQKIVFGLVQGMCVLVLVFCAFLFYMKPVFVFGEPSGIPSSE